MCQRSADMDDSLLNKQPWQKIVAKYQNPIRIKSIFQLANTFVLYVIAWVIMVKFLKISFWLMFPVAVIAAGFMVRLFIIFHDCGHGSYFKSQKANNFWGFVTGVLIFTPYHQWWHEHAVHHSHAGDLDERGWGDVWTITVQEYCKASRWAKIKYRFARNPICLFIIGPPILFFIVQRFPLGKIGKRRRRSAHQTNLGILAMATVMSFFIGFKAYFLIQLLVLSIASSVGIWLFYLQHQFEGVYWERHAKWDYVTEALKGSSYLKFPRILQWFTGNIGFHHIHHISPRIPNYLLERCYKENAMFQNIKPITFLSSFKALTFRLWDEQNNRLVGFAYLKKLKHL